MEFRKASCTCGNWGRVPAFLSKRQVKSVAMHYLGRYAALPARADFNTPSNFRFSIRASTENHRQDRKSPGCPPKYRLVTMGLSLLTQQPNTGMTEKACKKQTRLLDSAGFWLCGSGYASCRPETNGWPRFGHPSYSPLSLCESNTFWPTTHLTQAAFLRSRASDETLHAVK